MPLEGSGMKRARAYIDTSVVGGCFDKEYEKQSRALFAMANAGKIVLLVSELLADELELAPERVRGLLSSVDADHIEAVALSDEAATLRDAYLAAGVVGAEHAFDAHHVALATVARADLIVSWNFRHIVHFEKIRGFNAVNLREGYLPVDIRSPLEVV
jgi:hypothetical protein